LPRPSPSNSPLVVLGRGAGLGSVLRTLRDFDNPLTVIVATAERADAPRAADGADDSAVSELRRSIDALTSDRAVLARALRRPLTIDRLGSHPLGNLVLGSLTAAFGDLGTASTWLGERLGINGAVLPATAGPLSYSIEAERRTIRGSEPTDGREPQRLRLVPERPQTEPKAIEAIAGAGTVVIAPGPLFSGVLAVTAIPAIREALRAAPGTILWIANLGFEPGDSLHGQLDTLHRHQVRVDAVLFDPAAADPEFGPGRLAARGVEAIPRRLASQTPGTHDRQLLAAVLAALVSGRAASTPGGRLPG
jgi:uncharacterized cofD-like protein